MQLIRENPMYKKMSPEEVIGKFVSFKLMVKDSKHIINLEQGATSTLEVQPVAFKATEEKKGSPCQPQGSQLMPPSLTTRRWLLSLRSSSKSSNKGKEKNTNTAPRGFATDVVSPATIVLNVHMQVKVTRTATRKGKQRWRRRSTTTRRRVARRT
jgi:hypothetical protein